MTTREEKLLLAKDRLCTALGETNTPIYMSNLKMWFRKLWTKEQFDLECRKLFTPEQKHLHNEFFIAILNKITTPWHIPNDTDDADEMEDIKEEMTDMDERNEMQVEQVPNQINMLDGIKEEYEDEGEMEGYIEIDELDEKPNVAELNKRKFVAKKRKKVSKLPEERVAFKPIELYDYLEEEEDEDRSLPTTPLQPPIYALDDLFLPDTSSIMGRLLIAAWEYELESAEDEVVEIIVNAVQVFLKNIIDATMKTRKHYRTTSNGNFSYDYGIPIKNPFVRNTVTRQIIDDKPFALPSVITTHSRMEPCRKENDPDLIAACENIFQSPVKGLITTLDVYNALQDKNIIPCHSIYAPNIERISQTLH